MRRDAKLTRMSAIVAGLALVFVAVGCGEKAAELAAEKAIEKAIESDAAEDGEKVDVKVDLSEGTMTVTGEDGEKVNMQMDAEKGTMTMTGEDGEQVNVKMDAEKGTMTVTDASGANAMTIKADGDAGTMTVGGEEGFKIDATEDGATMTSADGMKMVSGANAKLPDDFPTDIPLYKGMQLVRVTTMPDEGMAITATTSDAADKVAAFYKKEAEANGWKEEMSMDMGELKNLQYSKENRGLGVMVMSEEGETGIQLTIVNK